MVRKLVSLCLVLPLLLPQGVCVCDFVSPKCAPTAQAATQPESETFTCSCRKHRRTCAQNRSCFQSAQVQQTGRSVPADQQEEHIPGCPAKAGGGLWKEKPADPPALAGSIVVRLFPVPDGANAPSCVGEFPSLADPYNHPLYLTLLTLRI